MDAIRFDDLARGMARSLPRRQALRVLGTTVLGVGMGSSANYAAARVCRQVGERCGKGSKGRCCDGASCRKRASGRGVCTCRAGLTECRGHCFEVASDPLGCGLTCEVCPDDTDCCNGTCCPAGQRCCGGVCTDLTADDRNCGGCTQACPQGLICCDSRCREFYGDPRHCGACGHACGAGQTCVNGQCACRPGFGDCGDGVCRNFQTDSLNCGVCRHQCAPSQVCQGGQCVCRPGLQICGAGAATVCGIFDNGTCTIRYECCTNECDFAGGEGRCYPCRGQLCNRNLPCCPGLECLGRPQDEAKFCGGCAGQDQPCYAESDCCFTDCTPDGSFNSCLSHVGGRCAANSDCRTCYAGGECVNACVGGRCRV